MQHKQEQIISQIIAHKQQQKQEQRNTTTNNFQNSYFRFLYSIPSKQTKKRYPDRFKTFVDYIQIPGSNIEERLLNFHNQTKQNPQWLQNSLLDFIVVQKERVIKG
jgi:hypothetical protein